MDAACRIAVCLGARRSRPDNAGYPVATATRSVYIRGAGPRTIVLCAYNAPRPGQWTAGWSPVRRACSLRRHNDRQFAVAAGCFNALAGYVVPVVGAGPQLRIPQAGASRERCEQPARARRRRRCRPTPVSAPVRRRGGSNSHLERRGRRVVSRKELRQGTPANAADDFTRAHGSAATAIQQLPPICGRARRSGFS